MQPGGHRLVQAAVHEELREDAGVGASPAAWGALPKISKTLLSRSDLCCEVQAWKASLAFSHTMISYKHALVITQEKEGSQRVCYAAANDEQFAFVRKLAREAKLATYAVVEKGQTDVQTVMAVGPVPADLLIKMTSSLHAPIQAHRLS